MQLSSCQIYNVEKRIQEDHLQQLALFSEYGRMALSKTEEMAAAGDEAAEEGGGDGHGDGKECGDSTAGVHLRRHASASFRTGAVVVPSGVGLAAKAKANAEARRLAAARASGGDRGGKRASGTPADDAGAAAAGAKGAPVVSRDWVERPFQRLEFLVRDWQVRCCRFGWLVDVRRRVMVCEVVECSGGCRMEPVANFPSETGIRGDSCFVGPSFFCVFLECTDVGVAWKYFGYVRLWYDWWLAVCIPVCRVGYTLL